MPDQISRTNPRPDRRGWDRVASLWHRAPDRSETWPNSDRPA